MQFRRNGLRDERRRRALMDDRASDSGKQAVSSPSADPVCQSKRTYSKTAVDERRIRVVDVVPVYVLHVSLIYVAIIATVSLLLALHHYGANIVRWADLSRVDSLGTYLSAGSLFAGAMLAFLTYRIRRHRLDDYRGRYRCWLWFAGLLLFASLDCMLNFRTDVARGLEAITRVRLLGQTDGWWVVVWSVAYGAMALRALIEARESIGTILVGMLSAVLVFIGMALQLDLIMVPTSLPTELAFHAAQLTGTGLLLATLIQYTRYVWLDAQGLVSRRATVVSETETESEAAAKTTTRRTKRTTKKASTKPENDEPSEEEAVETKRGWFSFGRKKVADESTDAEVDSEKPAAKPSRTSKKAAEADGEEASPAKRSWFSFGKKKDGETEEEIAQPAAKATRSVKTSAEEEVEETQPKRSWFSFGRKKADDDAAEAEKPVAKKPKIAAETTDEADLEEKQPRKSWFSWGKKSAEEAPPEDEAAAEESRTTMTPRVKTRPKPQPAASNQPPTITGKYSQESEFASAESPEDEEILRLESKPEHELSKAERRRLKKLKRRAAA
ncbi:ZIP family metal transporter [Bremerella sp. T1]|uniref:hypothetical protein n=1 Tax=Bremerella sp. TYQ1 TaxID=3119568 RepID=UPI001CCA6D9F|nr:hypothetical protein [Bremerella volcania]UBM38313.1 hypothetical protein LA756_10515 [Bremerella volcania]